MNITRSPADAGVSLWLIVYRVHICKPLAFPAVSCYNVVSNIMHIFSTLILTVLKNMYIIILKKIF